MKTIRICVGCGKPLPSDAPGGLCPECLLKSNVPTTPVTAGSSPARPRAVPVPGEMFGKYRIERMLGQGGMGEVYEAEHIESGRRVALKAMGHTLGSEQDRKRFLREGRLAAAVNHPNVVYVFGSEEIESVPVIAMELVQGGTLRERLKSEGRLAISEAVEATLQIIAGLEAASDAGVLHRDIKPANCFVSPDGVVKVGDFGLSVSTLARGESLLTATGSVLGTPAYASPEQLRGEELDVRSDIYSVGATLYHLLTGRMPFGATDFVKLITEVLDKQPAAANSLRADIPPELSRVVARCLVKDRKSRFQTYAELREALLPFKASEVTPASPGRRFLAGVVDEAISYGPCVAFTVYRGFEPMQNFMLEQTLPAALVCFVCYLFYLLYYAIPEGLWGAALGKTLCGIRVVGPERHAPGFARALVRSIIYLLSFSAPTFILALSADSVEAQAAIARGDSLIDWLGFPLWLALFVTMRRRNGFAAVHDLLTHTRVVVRPRTEPRPGLSTLQHSNTPVPPLPTAAALPVTLGPYTVQECLWRRDGEQLLSGIDPALRRKVWLHTRTGGASTTSMARRDLSRPARLRWLNGGVGDSIIWDAYEAPDGKALVELAKSPVPWSAVRFWLLDLTEELTAANGDPGTAPVLSLDRVWISSSGRAVLLDFPAPGTGASSTPLGDMQNFLIAVAGLCLDATALPQHAHGFIESLRRGSFEKPEFIAGNLRSLVGKPAEVTRPWRTASLILIPSIILLLAGVIGGTFAFERVRWERAWATLYPDKPSLFILGELQDRLRNARDSGDAAAQDVRDVRVYIAHQYGPMITNETFWNRPELVAPFAPLNRDKLMEIAREYAERPADMEELGRKLQPHIEEEQRLQRLVPFQTFVGTALAFTVFAALVGLVGWLFGVSLNLRLFSIVVVDRQGRRASRARLLGRWAAVWVPVLVLCGAAGALVIISSLAGTAEMKMSEQEQAALTVVAWIVAPLALAMLAALVAYAGIHPTRGLQDRIAGTRLVPK